MPRRRPTLPTTMPPAVMPATPSPATVYITNLAPGSRRAMVGALERLASILAPGTSPDALPWHTLRPIDVQGLRARLLEVEAAPGKRLAPATLNRILAALRGVLRAAWQAGAMDSDSYARCVAAAKGVKGTRLAKGRMLAPEELRRLFQRIARLPSPQRERDAALLAVGYACGLRREELCRLDVGDYHAGRLRVLGKGDRERAVYLDNGSKEALEAWLRVRGREAGPLLVPIRGRSLVMRRLSPQSVYARLDWIGARAGVKQFSPHDLRRSLISSLLDQGADLAAVQRLAGHASPTTTARYDRRSEKVLERLAKAVEVPFIA